MKSGPWPCGGTRSSLHSEGHCPGSAAAAVTHQLTGAGMLGDSFASWLGVATCRQLWAVSSSLQSCLMPYFCRRAAPMCLCESLQLTCAFSSASGKACGFVGPMTQTERLGKLTQSRQQT